MEKKNKWQPPKSYNDESLITSDFTFSVPIDRSFREITFITIDRVSKYCSKSINWHTYRYTYIKIIYTHRKLGYNYEWRVSKHYGIGTRDNIKCLSFVAPIVSFSFGTIEINTINFSFYFDFYSPWPTSKLVVYTMTFYHLHNIWLLSVLSMH